jgi:hypothetical protein
MRTLVVVVEAEMADTPCEPAPIMTAFDVSELPVTQVGHERLPVVATIGAVTEAANAMLGIATRATAATSEVKFTRSLLVIGRTLTKS